MAVKTWMWNLGVVGVVATVGGCKDGKIADACHSTPEGYSAACYEEEDDYEDYENYDDYDYDYDYDQDYDEPECSDDDDCDRGVCEAAETSEAYCAPYPSIPVCSGAPEVGLTWVRQGTGTGSGVGLAGRAGEPQRMLLVGAEVDGVEVPVSVADVEAGAVPQPLPLELAGGETVVGIEQADLDADGDFDLLVTLSSELETRVVPLRSEADGVRVALDPVVFGEPAGAAKLRRLQDGTFSLFVHSATWSLLQADSLEEGGFAEPAPSPWGTEHVVDYAVAPLDGQTFDGLLAAVNTQNSNRSVIEALIDGIRVDLGLAGEPQRRVLADSLAGFVITADTTNYAFTSVESAFAGDDAVRTTRVDHLDNPVQQVAMTDMDADGQGELVLLHVDGNLSVVYSASSEDACVEAVLTGADFDTILTPASGTGEGVVLSGSKGLLSVRGSRR